MSYSNSKNPIWAWVVLIGGGFFFVSTVPASLLTIFVSIRQGELSFFSIIYYVFALVIFILIIWAMVKAIRSIKAYQKTKGISVPQANTDFSNNPTAEKSKKPIWPWIVIGSAGLLLLTSGPGIIMLPIMPLFLAGMSTDSGNTPEYVPILIFVVGYILMILYVALVVKAIKRLKRN
jgi:hypothetical protein